MTDFSIDAPPFTAYFNALHHKFAPRPTKGRPGRIFLRLKALKIDCDGGDSMVKSGKKINSHLSDSVYTTTVLQYFAFFVTWLF